MLVESDEWVRFSINLPMRHEPGKHWCYAGVNSMLLAGILETVTGRSVVDFAIDNLFDPLGIATFVWESSPCGRVAGQGFLSLRGRDQLKLGQLYLDGGVWAGQRVVSRQWTEQATRPLIALPDQENAGYGYQWWFLTIDFEGKEYECFLASGNGGNKIYVIRDLDLVVSIASAAYAQPYGHMRSHRALRDVLRAVS